MFYESSESTKSNHRHRFIAYFDRFSSAVAGTIFTGLYFFIQHIFFRIFFMTHQKNKTIYIACPEVRSVLHLINVKSQRIKISWLLTLIRLFWINKYFGINRILYSYVKTTLYHMSRHKKYAKKVKN